MSLLGVAAEKVAKSVVGSVAENVIEKVADKISVEKGDVQKYEFDYRLWIERKSSSKNSKSLVLDNVGYTKYIIKRHKYNSNNPSIQLLDNNKNTVCLITIHSKFFTGKCDCNINMNGIQITRNKFSGCLDKEFLNEFGYAFKYKMKGSYSYITNEDNTIMYIKDYYARGERGLYLECKDKKDILVGLTLIMVRDILEDGLKRV